MVITVFAKYWLFSCWWVQGKGEELLQSTKDTAGAAQNKAADAAQAAKNKTSDAAQAAKNKTCDATQSAKNMTSDATQSAGHSAQQGKEQSTGFIQQVVYFSPFRSMLMWWVFVYLSLCMSFS
jgi:hypothetical protein